MEIKVALTVNEEQEFVNEDKQIEVVNKLTDDEEIDAAIELAREEAIKADSGETEKDTSPESKGPEVISEEKKPDIPAETVQPEKKVEGEFTVTDEFINKQPEEVRALLNNFKGKGRADLAKSAANAIALKNPYIRDNAEAIEAIAKRIQTGTDEELVKSFIDTQKEAGKPPEQKVETKAEEPKKIELPTLEETEEVKKMINSEVVNNLKKKYPGLPDDPNSIEYKDFLRDMQEDDPEKVQEFIQDKKDFANRAKTDLQKVAYAQHNHAAINNQRYEGEVETIKRKLATYGINEKDLGVDLTLTKDERGLLFNKTLNSLMLDDRNNPDPFVLGYVGDLTFLRIAKDRHGLTPLSRRFLDDYRDEIMSLRVNKETDNIKKEIERLKDENLNDLGTHKTPGSLTKALTSETINKLNDDAALDKIMQNARASVET